MSITLVFHYTRCGSTVVSDVLAQIPSVLHFGELLNPNNEWPRRLNQSDFNVESGAKNSPLMVANFLKTAIRESGKPQIGSRFFFELTNWDFHRSVVSGDVSDFCKLLAENFDNDFIFVQLVRHNVFRRFLSSKIAEITGLYHSYSAQVPRDSVYIDVTEMIQDISHHLHLYKDHAERFSSKCGEKFFRMSYEDDIEVNPILGARKIMGFSSSLSGAESSCLVAISPRLQRISVNSLERQITNYEEVIEALEKNGYGWMAG